MKIIFLLILFGFVHQSCNAGVFDIMDVLPSCLMGNGLTNSISDRKLIYAIGDPQQVSKLSIDQKIKITQVIACLYHELYPKERLYESLIHLMDRDDMITEDQMNKMEETLYDCHSKAAGNDAKLLDCLNIMKPPFDHLIAIFRDFPDGLQWCYVKCRYSISEMYTLERSSKKSFSEFINDVDREKLGCHFACKAEEGRINNPESTLHKKLSQMIHDNQSMDEKMKNELLQTLNRCSMQASRSEDEYYELVQCLNLFEPPFLYIF